MDHKKLCERISVGMAANDTENNVNLKQITLQYMTVTCFVYLINK